MHKYIITKKVVEETYTDYVIHAKTQEEAEAKLVDNDIIDSETTTDFLEEGIIEVNKYKLN
jgi:hypothetical protein